MLQTTVSDRELLEAARRGDEHAFALLHERYRHHVRRVALRILGQHEDAEDVCQEVFLRLYQRPPVLDGPQALRLWLTRVTTNLALNALRAQRRARFHWLRWFRLDWPRQQAADADHTGTETALLVRSVLEELSERDRALLALRSIGLTYDEIAQTLGLRPNSVGTLLARAERRFRQRYEALASRGKEVGS
ncbi:MAG: sigma-70 family RNA polymerase sigma factor [Thermomicrobium sp.]|nr:sigma-70 family RNA polymerase sigma factor [Thermomicrobium sp.]